MQLQLQMKSSEESFISIYNVGVMEKKMETIIGFRV